jgi:uncharacterized protein
VILPDVEDRLTEGFWAAARAGTLTVQKCADCDSLRFPPSPACARCRSMRQEWEPVSGRGTVWSYVAPHPPLLGDYAEAAPYTLVVVTLAEGEHLRMVGNLVSSPDAELGSVPVEGVRIADPVQVGFREIGDGVRLPVWTPAPG